MAGKQLKSYQRQLVHASRMTTAGVGAFALVYLLGLSEGLWATITAIVVTQSSVGGSLKVARDQAIGSLFGALYGMLVMLLIAPRNAVESALTLIVVVAPLSFLAARNPGYRVAPITGVIMLLAGAGLGLGPVDLAAGRIVEVLLGCAVGIVISVLIVPARASQSVIETTAQVAGLLAKQLRSIAAWPSDRPADLGVLARKIRETMIRLEQLVGEAARERRALLTDIPDVEPLLRTARRLRFDVSMLRRAAREAGNEGVDEHISQAWRRAIHIGADQLEAIERRTLPGDKASRQELLDAVKAFRLALETLRQRETNNLSTITLARLFGMSFALDQFRRNLEDLNKRFDEVAPQTS